MIVQCTSLVTLEAFHPESHSEQGHGSLCGSAWPLPFDTSWAASGAASEIEERLHKTKTMAAGHGWDILTFAALPLGLGLYFQDGHLFSSFTPGF